MKKLNKLFAILFAVLGVTTLKAQTNIIADWDGGSNTGKPTTFGWTSSNTGRSWGELNGGGARVTNTYIGYKKEDGSTYSYVADSEPSTQILWIRYNNNSETYTYTFSGLEAGKVYTFSGLVGWHNNSNAPTFTITVNGDKELAKVSKYCGTRQTLYPFSVDFMVPADNKSTDFTLKFKSNQGNDNMEALSALSIVENTAIANASQENPYDMTSWLKDAGFEEATGSGGKVNTPPGWTIKYTLSGWLDGTPNTTNPSEGSKCYNLWAGTVTSIDMYQTVTLPAGKYTVYADLRTDNVNNINDQGVYASVAGVITKSGTITNVAPTWNSKEGWNTLSATFNNGSAGEVIIGISSTGKGGSSGWFQADNVRLFYHGFDLTEANNALNALITTAQGIVSANEASPKSVEALNIAIAAGLSVAQNKEAIEQAATNLTNAINAANATITVCNEYRAMLALSESMYTNSTADDKSTFQAAINKAKSDFNTAANVDAISTIVTDLQNAQKAYCLVAAPTEGHPFDLTWLVVNPKFDEGTKGWTHTTGAPNWGIATNQGGAITGNFFENWKWESYTGDIYQEITGLPNGKYRLTVAAFRDQLIDGASDGDAVYVFANDVETLVNAAAPAFYTVEVTTMTGSLKFGVRSKVAKYRWMGIDNATLLFVAGLDLSKFEAAYNTALEAAIAARDNADYQSVAGIERTNLVNAINLTVEETKESYMEATSALNEATAVFIAAKSDYETLNSEITIAKELGMTDAAINAITNNNTGAKAYTDLKVAEYNYIQGTYTERATLGSWTETFAEDLDGEGYKTGGPKYFNEWGNATRTAKQTVKLPAGDYAISSIGRGQVGTSGYLYYKIGETTNKVDFIMKGNRGLGVDVNGVANFSGDGEYNCNGEGFGWEYRFITFHLDAETEVEIGVSATFANAWVSIYAPELLTTEASVKALRLSEIATALGNVPTGKMDATVQVELNDAVAAAENVTSASTIDELNTVSTVLADAIANAKSSVADYAAIKTYIEKANNIDASIAENYKAQYDNGNITETATNVFQTLEVATYNYVTEEFSYPVELEANGWIPEGPTAPMSGQHFDGTNSSSYLEQSAAAWGWDAWSISYKHDKTLPAGDYVFKVAGRRASGTGNTMSLVVTNINDPDNVVELGLVNDFPEGDTGLGINKKGETSFDANDKAEFANNGAGRGWQWRYVKFTLSSETKVRIAVNAEATTKYQWVGFCNATLQMNEETYLTANMEALDAPTAAAEALANAVPMGADAVKELNAALNRPVTTGQDLWDKIEALNTAVANANAWVAAYNEAKAPLVAALERFEADYNKDGVKMSKEAWNNVLEKVKAAALAKDVTDSYDGFADAEKDLTDALAEADKSIKAYETLEAAIEDTKALAGANVGDQPFQRPVSAQTALKDAIATAQTAYDKAEADATEVKSTLDTAVEAFNNAELNAPAEGLRFYIKVATEGHGKNGNAWLMTLGATSANNPTGYGLNTDNAAKGYLAQAFIFTQVEGNLYNISIERAEGTVYLTYGALNGSAAGWKNQQIQATTNAENKGEFKIVPTGQNGILKIFNTVDNNYIDCQGGGAIYTDTNIENEEFAFELASEHEVTLTLSKVGWATLILPFNAELPEGVKAYSCGEADKNAEEDQLTLVPVEDGIIKANTPYLMNGQEGTHVFTGYGLADKDSYTSGLFTGTYVEYKTTANSNTYVLQNKGGEVAFYLVGESAQPKVGAYRCYMTYDNAAGAPMFRIGEDETTSIHNSEFSTQDSAVVYDLMGRRVTTMEKGSMYIVNGKKVVVK